MKFFTPTGTEFFAEYNDGYYELEATGGKTGDGVEVYAIYMPDDSTKRSLGKLRIASYPKKEMTVSCIPVGDFNIDNKISEDLLNEIYAPYYINWTVSIDDPFTDTSWDEDNNGLQATDGEFWSEYTEEMRALRDVYTEQRGTDEESLYLFFFENGNTDENQLLGDMPLKSRFGFIFNVGDESSDEITKTAAHELGHGAFQLKHTFSNKYNIEKYTTQNLMDYAGGIELVKYQWDVIHDPQIKLFDWMQDEEEGQGGSLSKNEVIYMLREIRESFINNTIVKFPRNYIQYCGKVKIGNHIYNKGIVLVRLAQNSTEYIFNYALDENDFIDREHETTPYGILYHDLKIYVSTIDERNLLVNFLNNKLKFRTNKTTKYIEFLFSF